MDAKKPTGGKAFDALARALVNVPKKELDRQLKKRAEKRERRKKK
jgi:hypothetical protein